MSEPYRGDPWAAAKAERRRLDRVRRALVLLLDRYGPHGIPFTSDRQELRALYKDVQRLERALRQRQAGTTR